ncbi:hypothetical protein Tco_1160936, partial [Tanacetum coccineum]
SRSVEVISVSNEPEMFEEQINKSEYRRIESKCCITDTLPGASVLKHQRKDLSESSETVAAAFGFHVNLVRIPMRYG